MLIDKMPVNLIEAEIKVRDKSLMLRENSLIHTHRRIGLLLIAKHPYSRKLHSTTQIELLHPQPHKQQVQSLHLLGFL